MTSAGPTVLYLLDIPYFRDGDHSAGFYLGAHGLVDTWSGCSVYRSKDAGVSYQRLVDIGSACVGGSATTALATGTAGSWDLVNTVTVCVRGTLESFASASAPLILVGNEIVKYQVATLVSSKGAMTVYTLSKIKRGLWGTDAQVSTHVAGERVVLLDDAVIRVSGNVEDLNTSMLYRALSYGQGLTDVAAIPFTNTGRGMVPNTGSAYLSKRTITGATGTITAFDDTIYGNRATAQAITLPEATGSGKVLYVKQLGAGVITLTAGASTIDGETSQALSQWTTICVHDGAAGAWSII